MDGKRILFVDHDPNISGSTVSMRYLIDGFSKKKFDIVLVTPKNENARSFFKGYKIDFVNWKYKVELGLHFTNENNLFSLRGMKNIIRLIVNMIKGCLLAYVYIKKIKPDIIYINEYVLSQFSFAAKISNIPVVTHIRSPFIKGTFGIRRYLFSKYLKTFNNFIFAISEYEANQILMNVSNSKNNIKVVREFLDEDDFQLSSDKNILDSLSIPYNNKVILNLGGIEPIKGTLEILKAFSKLCNTHSDIHLINAGPIKNNPDYNQHCYNIINDNNLQGKISILNFIENVHQLIGCCDILVSGLSNSHFPRPIIEAWAQKKAVISSDTFHVKEFLEDGVDGLLYKVGSEDSLADKISMLLRNKRLLNTIGEAGFRKARIMFSAEKNINEILNYCITLV